MSDSNVIDKKDVIVELFSRDTGSPFVKAVSNNDINMVKHLVAIGHSVNTKDSYGNTPLHLAVQYDSLQILEYLLSIDNVDIDATNDYADTPLNTTLSKGKGTPARHGVQTNNNLLTSLEIISTFVVCRAELINILIKAGADINTKDYLGNTLLHKSVHYQRLDVMYRLLYYNADTNILNNQNQTPYMLALTSNCKEMEEVLLKYVDIDMNQCLIDNYFTRVIKIMSSSLYVSNFKALWSTCGNKRLCYVLYKLSELVEKFHQWTDVVVEYIKIVMEIDHFKPVIHNTKCKCIRFLVDLFAHGLIDQETVQKFICVLLMYNFSLGFEDIDYVFAQLGYCELITIMLHMDIPLRDLDTHPGMLIFSVILYDIRRTIDDIFTRFFFYLPVYNTKFLSHFFNYFSNPMLDTIGYVLMSWWGNDDEIIKKIKSLPNIPKLLELSRNKARDYIISKYNITRTSQYYTIVKNLGIPEIYQRILTFETALY